MSEIYSLGTTVAQQNIPKCGSCIFLGNEVNNSAERICNFANHAEQTREGALRFLGNLIRNYTIPNEISQAGIEQAVYKTVGDTHPETKNIPTDCPQHIPLILAGKYSFTKGSFKIHKSNYT